VTCLRLAFATTSFRRKPESSTKTHKGLLLWMTFLFSLDTGFRRYDACAPPFNSPNLGLNSHKTIAKRGWS
jgi:hypothetical protein